MGLGIAPGHHLHRQTSFLLTWLNLPLTLMQSLHRNAAYYLFITSSMPNNLQSNEPNPSLLKNLHLLPQALGLRSSMLILTSIVLITLTPYPAGMTRYLAVNPCI